MSWRTAARLLNEDLPSRRGVAFQLVSPVRADAVFAARALVGERGAHAAEALHRALEEFAPGGLVRDAGDLPARIELRALADEHYGPWNVPAYAAQVVLRPVILHVQARLESRNQPLGVRNVVHVEAAPGCCKTMTARALVKLLGEATARHYADDFSCVAFLLEAYKARTRLTQVTIVDNPAAPGAVRPGATCSYQYQMGSVLVPQSPVKGGVAETWVNTQQAFHNVGSISPGSRASFNNELDGGCLRQRRNYGHLCVCPEL